jgi:hypothetical protein
MSETKERDWSIPRAWKLAIMAAFVMATICVRLTPRQFSELDARRIQRGMMRSEVQAILGPEQHPKKSDFEAQIRVFFLTNNPRLLQDGTIGLWTSSRHFIAVFFTEDKKVDFVLEEAIERPSWWR